MILLAGCMSLDSFFFNPTRVDAYVLGGDVIPPELVEEVSFPAQDGAQLAGVWARQPTSGAQVFVYFHGNADNIDAYWSRVELYWEMGLDVFIFDYHGYGKSDGEATFDTVMTDGIAATDHVRDTLGVGHEDMVFHGLSLGGAVALATAVERTPKVVITEDMFASAQMLINDGSGMDLPDGWFMTEEWDNVANALLLTRPYLILHAAEDDFVDPSHAEFIYEKANEPKRLWLVPGANHDTSPEAAPTEYRENILCWIDQDCVE